MSMTAFHVERLGFQYRETSGEARRVFEDLNVTIMSGCITAVMGPSGSGKSTFGKLLAGALNPSSGQVKFGAGFEKEINRFYVDQDPSRVYFPWKTVGGNLRQPLGLLGWNKDAIDRRIAELLEELDLKELVHRFPAFLSGGQKSRLALARVLSWRPRSVILDEYLADLDVVTRRRVVHALRRYVQDHEMTVVMISHDPAEVASLADRCLVFGGNPGHVVADIALTEKHDDREAEFRKLIHLSLSAQLVTT